MEDRAIESNGAKLQRRELYRERYQLSEIWIGPLEFRAKDKRTNETEEEPQERGEGKSLEDYPPMAKSGSRSH